MSLHLYTTLKTWRRTKHDLKLGHDLKPGTVAARTPKPNAETLLETANAAVYAAGIACAGQVAEQPRR